MNLADIETQATDIRFLVTHAGSLQQGDSSKVAVIGYSIGGIASVFAAAQDKRITALVELDGSIRYFNKLVRSAGYVTPDKVGIPMLYLAHRPLHDSIENQIKYKADLSGSFINDMQTADLYLFNINALDHRDFSSWFIRIRDMATFEDYSPTEVSTAYGWMARYVLEFLNSYTGSDAAAKNFLSVRPEDNGVPKHLMEKVIRQQK
jgi:pimeloyl-ACP methyl ester carboxylesterase